MHVEIIHRDPGHRNAEAARHFGKDSRILEVGCRLDDRVGAGSRIAALEDSGTHEHRLGAELHGQRRIGGRRQATSTKQRYRKFTGLGNLLYKR